MKSLSLPDTLNILFTRKQIKLLIKNDDKAHH